MNKDCEELMKEFMVLAEIYASTAPEDLERGSLLAGVLSRYRSSVDVDYRELVEEMDRVFSEAMVRRWSGYDGIVRR